MQQIRNWIDGRYYAVSLAQCCYLDKVVPAVTMVKVEALEVIIPRPYSQKYVMVCNTPYVIIGP
jgi:hypothetical protein